MIGEMSELTAERFEQTLTEGISGLRLELHDGLAAVRQEMNAGSTALRQEMHAEFTAVRQEMHAEFTAVRQEMYSEFKSARQDLASTRVEFIRWSFAFWVGQLAAIAGLLALMLRAAGR
jgi:hypothetical protein